MLLFTTSAAVCVWLLCLALPWRPWSTREYLEAVPDAAAADFLDVTVLIPARDEASCVAVSLNALVQQGCLGRIVLIDDQSRDGTGDIVRALDIENLTVVSGSTPPPEWSGKLWALEQGFRQVETRYTLLVDADIELKPGTLSALRARMAHDELELVSVMAHLHMQTAWEKLLLPPFIYFFKLIYPFALSNDPTSRIAAAAGGCVLIESRTLRSIGGFGALHGAIIDDCTLARLVKRAGGRTWIGLSHDVRALRPYESLKNIWNMVARSAFTQLRYSTVLLGLCSALLALSFIVPVVGLVSGTAMVRLIAVGALAAMGMTYLPTVQFYELSPLWILTLPLAACLFLAMTWTSAIRYWRGERARWKDRSYERSAAD